MKAGVFRNVGPGPVGVMAENWEVRAQVRLADGPEYFPLEFAHRRVGVLADLTERAVMVCGRFADQPVRDLIVALSRELGGIHTFHVISAARDNEDARSIGNLLERFEPALH